MASLEVSLEVKSLAFPAWMSFLRLMASLTRKPGTRFWIACFTDDTGRQRQRSTKLTSRNEAMKLALEWESAYRKGISEQQVHRVLSDVRAELYGEPLRRMSTADFMAGWLAKKEKENAPGTHKRYADAIRRFLGHQGERAKLPLSSVTQSEVALWREHLAAELSPGSVNLYLKILRSALTTACKTGLVSENPAALIGRVRTEVETRRPFTGEELRKLLGVADDEWRGAILMALYTGQRLGDIATVRWAQVDLPRGEIAFTTQKTRRRIVLPLAEPLQRHLLDLPASDKPSAPIFPSLCADSDAGGSGPLSKRFYAIMVDAGLAKPRPKEGKGRGGSKRRAVNELSFHCLRHNATSMLKNAGVNDAVARDIIGHESAAVSRTYTHIDDDAKRRAIALLPDITTKPAKTNPVRPSVRHT